MQTSVDPSRQNVARAAASTATDPTGTSCAQKTLLDAINVFESWLDANGDSSFDPYDVWGTRYGLKARRLYYTRICLDCR